MGVFLERRCLVDLVWVFPTLVGVFPQSSKAAAEESRLPHARGGVSKAFTGGDSKILVFPTLVGVFPQPMR